VIFVVFLSFSFLPFSPSFLPFLGYLKSAIFHDSIVYVSFFLFDGAISAVG